MATLTREFPIPTQGEELKLRTDQLDRFMKKVQKLVINPEHGECWIWEPGVGGQGYGRFYMGRDWDEEEQRLKSYNRAAHVISYLHFVGPIPDTWVVDHMCNNKACVNPEHLEAIPNLKNLQRAQERRPWKRHNQYGADYTDPNPDWRLALK